MRDRGTDGISRRGFFAAAGSAAAAGILLGGADFSRLVAQEAAGTLVIPKRIMGRTGLAVGVISGNEQMREPALINAALEAGVNYWHKGGAYLADAVKNAGRENIYVEICLDPSGSVEKDMENFKGRLGNGLEYADFYKIHIKYDERSVEAFGRLKDEGLVKYLSASFHNYDDAIRKIESGAVDQVQVSGSPTSGAKLAGLLEAAKKANVGVLLMKTMMGGEKGWANEDLKKAIAPYTETGLSTPQGIVAACLAMDGVTTVTTSSKTIENFTAIAEAAAKTVGITPATVIPTTAAAFCRVCGACDGVCPNGVAVQDIMRAEMYALGYREETRARELYASLGEKRNALACGDCGACQKACPSKVASPQRIAATGRLLA